MRPNDITEEEIEAAVLHLGGPLDALEALAAQNELRDERVRADERERIARSLESTSGGNPRAFVSDIAAAIREGGRDER